MIGRKRQHASSSKKSPRGSQRKMPQLIFNKEETAASPSSSSTCDSSSIPLSKEPKRKKQRAGIKSEYDDEYSSSDSSSSDRWNMTLPLSSRSVDVNQNNNDDGNDNLSSSSPSSSSFIYNHQYSPKNTTATASSTTTTIAHETNVHPFSYSSSDHSDDDDDDDEGEESGNNHMLSLVRHIASDHHHSRDISLLPNHFGDNYNPFENDDFDSSDSEDSNGIIDGRNTQNQQDDDDDDDDDGDDREKGNKGTNGGGGGEDEVVWKRTLSPHIKEIEKLEGSPDDECPGCTFVSPYNSKCERRLHAMQRLFFEEINFKRPASLCLHLSQFYEMKIRKGRPDMLPWSPRLIYEHYWNHITDEEVFTRQLNQHLQYCIKDFMATSMYITDGEQVIPDSSRGAVVALSSLCKLFDQSRKSIGRGGGRSSFGATTMKINSSSRNQRMNNANYF